MLRILRGVARQAMVKARQQQYALNMSWHPTQTLADFGHVALLAGVTLDLNDMHIELLPAPHAAPAQLPLGQMAVYVFTYAGDVLKVGKVGSKSQARYTNQHYNPASALSTLAASVIADAERIGLCEVEIAEIGDWIRANVDRVNILLPVKVGIPVLTLLESFLQCRLRPRYEGFKSQRALWQV